MKLTEGTLATLKSYTSINNSILVRRGNILRTISPSKTTFAHMEVADSFPCDFAIYDLSRFLAVISLIDNPDLAFGDSFVTISNANTTMRYVYADETHVIKAPETNPNPVEKVASVVLTERNLQSLLKSAGVMKFNDLALIADGTNVSFVVYDPKNSTSDEYRISVDTTEDQFNFIFKMENLKVIPADYKFEIHRLKSGKFVANLEPVTVGAAPSYWISSEATSSHGAQS